MATFFFSSRLRSETPGKSRNVMTSSRSNNALVAECRSWSISSLIEASFSINVSVEGT